MERPQLLRYDDGLIDQRLGSPDRRNGHLLRLPGQRNRNPGHPFCKRLAQAEVRLAPDIRQDHQLAGARGHHLQRHRLRHSGQVHRIKQQAGPGDKRLRQRSHCLRDARMSCAIVAGQLGGGPDHVRCFGIAVVIAVAGRNDRDVAQMRGGVRCRPPGKRPGGGCDDGRHPVQHLCPDCRICRSKKGQAGCQDHAVAGKHLGPGKGPVQRAHRLGRPFNVKHRTAQHVAPDQGGLCHQGELNHGIEFQPKVQGDVFQKLQGRNDGIRRQVAAGKARRDSKSDRKIQNRIPDQGLLRNRELLHDEICNILIGWRLARAEPLVKLDLDRSDKTLQAVNRRIVAVP